jgi:Tfp pilus assembly protein PilZ
MSMSLRSSELRRHERVEIRRRAWCEHRDWTLYLPLANVSRGGLFIQTSRKFARGERLRVCLADRAPVMILEVEVVWSAAPPPSAGRVLGVGCVIASFTEGEDAYAALVDQLVLGLR